MTELRKLGILNNLSVDLLLVSFKYDAWVYAFLNLYFFVREGKGRLINPSGVINLTGNILL